MTSIRIARFFLLSLALPSCVSRLPLENFPCPCAAGWSCCPGADVCVKEGTSCPMGALRIDPAELTVPTDRQRRLTASGEVLWSVVEGSAGGSIDAHGLYTAPMQPGTFHVLAALAADPQETVTTTITVVPLTIDRVVGQSGGTGYADGIGADARFYRAAPIVADDAGHLFVGDAQTIRRVDIASAAVTTIAGSPRTSGLVDGIGTKAQFGSARGLSVDRRGNLFVADWTGVRKIVIATGDVSTIVASGVVLRSPVGIAADEAGHLYVSDELDHTILSIDPSTGAVTTLAGTAGVAGSVDGPGAAARFNRPGGIARDDSGNLYVADSGNGTLRRVALATGEVTTVAGAAGRSGTNDGFGAEARFSFPIDVAFMAGRIYVADRQLMTTVIRGIVVATSPAYAVDTLFEVGSDARFGGVTCDHQGDIYYTNGAAVGTAAFGTHLGPPGIVAGKADSGGSVNGDGAGATLRRPAGVAVDAAGTIFVSEGSDIRILDPGNNRVSTLAAPAQAIVRVGSGDLIFTDGNSSIGKLSPTTGAVTTIAGIGGSASSNILKGYQDGIGAAARFYNPTGLVWDGGSNVYIADSGNKAIRKLVLATGEVTTLAGDPGGSGNADGIGKAAHFNDPVDLTMDEAGNLYVADVGYAIRKVVPASGEVTTVAGSIDVGSLPFSTDSNSLAASKIVSDGRGGLFVSSRFDHTVRKINLSSGEVVTVVGRTDQAGVRLGPVPAGLNAPSGLAITPAGDLLVADRQENVVLLVH